MELLLLGLLVLVKVVIALLGLVFLAAFSLGVWYGPRFFAGHETRATGGLLQTRWRGARLWAVLKFLCRYEQATAQRRPPLPPGPAVFACQPHGMFALTAALATFSGDLDRPGSRVLLVVHNWYWWVPGLRDLMLALGCIDKRWSSIEAALAQGFSVLVLPNGVFEMGPPVTVAPPPTPRLMGLVRHVHASGLALPLVPVWLRGEDMLCWVWHSEPHWLKRVRAWSLKTLGVSAGAFFMPRVWAWPRLTPLVGPCLLPADYDSAAAFQAAYDASRRTLSS